MDIVRALIFFVFFVGSAVAVEPDTVPAVWPVNNQYPTCSNSAAFSCPGTCSGGDSKFSFQTKSIIGSVPGAFRGVKYYGWSDGSVYTGCYVYPDKPFCPAGYEWDGDSLCKKVDPCKGESGKSIGRESIYMFLESAPTANSICVDGCTHQAKSVICAPRFGAPVSPGDVLQVSQGEECEAQGPFKNMGYKCSSGVPGAGSPYAAPPKPYYDNGKGIADCAASGGAWGEINGVGKCVKGLTNGTSGKGTGAGLNGTSSSTKSDTKTNADGSTTTTKTTDTTTCKDGVCKTETVTVTETTSSTGTKTSDTKTDSASKEQSDFCKSSPEHQLCVKNGMSGDCSAGFSCTGDPVQCATAKAAQEMKCALSSKTDGSTLADQMTAGNDPALQGENNPLIPKTVSLSSIAPTRTLSGSCPPPITVSLFGQTASYSFDAICPWIETLGRILVGLAWLTAFFIVSRSIK